MLKLNLKKKNQKPFSPRPPIVTILGHVDHGKTTLLDAIRHSNIAGREAGGITQSIGASKVKTKEGEITFIDTPGHAMFSKMRSRGTQMADIVVLVVAADDGVKPQTKEALQYIKETHTPLIVAITKTDLPSANIESAISELEKEGVLFEGRGGDTPLVTLSVKKNEGVENLIEMIHLVSQVNEISSDPDGDLEAVVIETNTDKRGSTVSLVVKEGSISTGDIIDDIKKDKVRGIFDYLGKPIKKAFPGDPVQIIGLNGVPAVGSSITSKGVNLSIDKTKIGKVSSDQLGIVLKAHTAGSLEAIRDNMPDQVVVLKSSVGDVISGDVFFAKSAQAVIVAFESGVSSDVRKLSETEGVKILSSRIVYELIEKLEELIEKGEVQILGKAEVLAVFPFNNSRVAGCKVIEGEIRSKHTLVLTRGKGELGTARIVSMKRGKENIEVAKVGEECGLILNPQLDFEVHDVLVSRQS